MRVGIIAAAGAEPTPEPRLGERDALLMRSRLELEDVGFTVYVVDPTIDLAEQLDNLLSELPEEVDDMVFYASCLLAVVDDGDCFLCLDPDEPDVGDALRDVAETLCKRARGGTLFMLELRYDNANADRTELTEVLANVQDCVASEQTGVELVAAVRPMGAHIEKIPSRLTAGVLEAIDEKHGKLTARQAYATAIQHTDFGDWPNALSYAAGRRPLQFMPGEAPVSEEPITEEPPTARPPQVSVDVDMSEPSSQPRPADGARDEPAVASPPAAAAPAPPAPQPEPTSVEPPGPDTEPSGAPAMDLTPTTPRVASGPSGSSGGAAAASQVVHAPQVTQRKRVYEEAPPSERRIAATTTVPKHLKPSAPASLPKVMIGARAKSAPAPASDPPPPSSAEPSSAESSSARPKRQERQVRPLLETFADGPNAKRQTFDAAPAEHGSNGSAPAHAPPDESAPMTQPQGTRASADGTERGGSKKSKRASSPATPRASSTLASADDGVDVGLDDISVEHAAVPPPAPSKKRPIETSVEDHIAAGDLARGAGRDDEARAQYKKALAKLGTKSVPQRAEVYVRIGEMSRKQGKTRVAISNYDKALSINPSDQRALAALIELNAEAGNWRGVGAAEDKYFANFDGDDETRLQNLLGSGDLWREGAQDIKKAKKRYETARDLAPKRVEPLEKLLLIQQSEGHIEHVLDLRRRIAALTEDRRARAEMYFGLGQYCLEQSRDDDAFASFELALDSDPTLLQALEVLSNALAQDQEWAELERVYEKMVQSFGRREQTEENVTVLAELHHRLALLHRDHLEDPAEALASLGHELALRPDQLSTRIMAADLAIEINDKEAALDHLRIAARVEPNRAETYHQIFQVARRNDDTEAAFLAASVAQMLEAADDRERIVHREHRVEGVPALHASLDVTAWHLLKGADHDASVDAIMRAIAPAVLRTRIKQLQTKDKLPKFSSEARQDLEKSTISAVRSIGWAFQFLGVAPTVVYIDEPTDAPLSAVFAKRQTTVVGKGALRGRTLGELAFLAGQHAALRLAEHELVAHLRNVDELTACFLAALQIVLGSTPVSGETAETVDALAKVYAAQQTAEEREALVEAVEAFSASGGRVNLRSWIAMVERCAARAGLLLCGDLETAARIIRDEGDGHLVSAKEILDDLAAFTISAEHVALRQVLGVSL